MNHRETRASSATPWTLALLIVACGDSEAPLPSSALAQAIALEYGSGAASAGSAASGSGAPTGAPSESDRDTTGSEPDDSELDAADADDDDPEDVAPTLPEPDPEPEPEPEPSASFPDCDGFSIIQANCGQGGCHGGASNLGNFAESEEAARSYIGRSGALTCASRGPIIDPQNPGESVLVQKLSDDPPCGNYMPPSASFLPAADVECITNWIANLE